MDIAVVTTTMGTLSSYWHIININTVTAVGWQ